MKALREVRKQCRDRDPSDALPRPHPETRAAVLKGKPQTGRVPAPGNLLGKRVPRPHTKTGESETLGSLQGPGVRISASPPAEPGACSSLGMSALEEDVPRREKSRVCQAFHSWGRGCVPQTADASPLTQSLRPLPPSAEESHSGPCSCWAWPQERLRLMDL